MPSTSERQAANAAIITEFRANGGQVGGPYAAIPLLLLTNHGARSGQSRTIPVAYTTDGDRFIIMAANGGRPTDPDWYHNLLAHPTAVVEVGTETFPVNAAAAVEPERTRLAAQMATAVPLFASLQERTTRPIPVIILMRAAQ
ncbi:MAG TPA: nitroreductase family deazaflavin-dependent oxidoreductase [Thermomicrobiales bacterium]|jgi:deazaflavin-dependent oxidoreductase (nitroreductase family)